MKASYRTRIGGLMRCCLQSLDDHMVAIKVPPREGDTVKCKWCDDEHGMVFTHGAWQWAKPDESAVKR
jgi:hypothetical protein